MTKNETINSSKPKKSTMLTHTKTKLKKGNQSSATKPNPKLKTKSLKSLMKTTPKPTPTPLGETYKLRSNYNEKYGNQVPNYSKNVKK
jgi:hypothetical protein|tara:strand:- start:1280 stop:1543 length:264 start_codon:yes stop_codon:yes gene_type:complete